ncbi:MAG: MFS transporter [Nocardioides sp.]
MASDLAAETTRPVTTAGLVVLLSATFMAQFDFFVVNVAAPSIKRNLPAGQASLALIVGAYAFGYAAALVLGGRLGDLYGRRRVLRLGMSAFTAASVLCSVATDAGFLITARSAQGLAAAMMLPQVLAVITAGTDAHWRARAMAWYSVAAGAGSIAGQVLGGLLVTADVAGLGWRLIFLVNLPIGIVGTALAGRLPSRVGAHVEGRSALDPLGALGFATGLALALVPLTMGRAWGWRWWTWASMFAAVLVLWATLRWQRVLRVRGGQPLLDLTLFRISSFRSGFIANAAFMACFGSYMFTLALQLQGPLGLTAFQAGLVFAPAGAGFSISALFAPRLVRRHGQAATVAGAAVAAGGLVALGAATAFAGSHASIACLTVIVVVISLGNGVVLPSLVGAGLGDVPPQLAGAGSGALATGQQFASAVGVAGIGTLYFATAGTGSGVGMAWAAAADALLVMLVAALVRRQARRIRADEL